MPDAGEITGHIIHGICFYHFYIANSVFIPTMHITFPGSDWQFLCDVSVLYPFRDLLYLRPLCVHKTPCLYTKPSSAKCLTLQVSPTPSGCSSVLRLVPPRALVCMIKIYKAVGSKLAHCKGRPCPWCAKG